VTIIILLGFLNTDAKYYRERRTNSNGKRRRIMKK